MLKYLINNEFPLRFGDVVVSKSPCAEAAPPTMVALVDCAESQTTELSQSWRWPRPDEGESLGMYQAYMMANLPLYVPPRA